MAEDRTKNPSGPEASAQTNDRTNAAAANDQTKPVPPPDHAPERQALIVGVGAGAGELNALRSFLAAVPPGSDASFVLVPQLDAREARLMVDFLREATSMPVHVAQDLTALAPGCVYVAPTDGILTCESGLIRVRLPQDERERRARLDIFFRTLAEDQGERAVCVLLAGAGAHGVVGLKAIREHGGLVLGQSPASPPGHGSGSAALAGLFDERMRVEELPARIVEYAAHLRRVSLAGGPADALDGSPASGPESRADGPRDARRLTPELQSHLAAIWRILRSRVGHDFSRYKPTTMLRRIQRRMHVRRIDSMPEYIRHLERDPQEAELLYRDLLIGVTHFFRDLEAFRALESKVVPWLAERPQEDSHIRIWVPGCATGEEAYSIAMLLREHIERSEARPRIQIFATDIDGHSLDIARQGRYPRSVLSQVSPERLSRFFRREQDEYVVSSELREMCLFTSHNLINDPPFSRLDLISCRNLLIYLDRDMQKLLVPLFHYALRGNGYLFLGPSENLAAHPELFEEVDKKHRIFRRQPSVRRPSVPFLRTPVPQVQPPGKPQVEMSNGEPLLSKLVERAVLEEHSSPAITVNQRFDIVYATGPTNRYLSLPPGQPQINLMQMAKRGLRLELYTALHQALNTEDTVDREMVVEIDGRKQLLRLIVRPLSRLGGPAGLYLVVLQELAAAANLSGALLGEGADRDVLRRLEADLEDTRQHLKVAVEKLEAKNEELRSSNEELLSMNEELQSANEELQTSKEELQSANEELETVNTEMARKVEELNRVNSDLLNLFQSTHVPTIFLDRELRIVRFTAAAREVFRLIDGDVGRSIEDIRRRFHDVDLEAACRRVLETLDRQIIEVTRPSDGTHFIMRISPYRTVQDVIDGVVLTFADVTPIKRAEEAVRRSETRYRSLVEATASVVWTTGADGRFTHPQPRFEAYTGQPFQIAGGLRPEGWIGNRHAGHRDFGWLEAVHPVDREEVWRRWRDAVRSGRDYYATGRMYHAASKGYRFFDARAVPIRDARGAIEEWVGIIVDVHDRRSTEIALRESEERLELAMEATELGIFDLDRTGGLEGAGAGPGEGGAEARADGCLHEHLRSNENTRRIHGLPVDREMTRQSFVERLHEDDRERVQQTLIDAFDTAGAGRHEIHYRVRWPDGSIHWVAAKARAHSEERDGKQHTVRLVGTIRDITETTRAQAELERHAAQQAAVSALGLLALRRMDLQQVLDAAVDLVSRTLRVPLAKVLELLPGPEGLLLRAGVGWQEGLVGKARLPVEPASQAGHALRIREPVVVVELAADARFLPSTLLDEHGAVSGLSVIIGGPESEPWGVLSVHTRSRQVFTPDDVNFLQAIANILTTAIERVGVHEALHEAKQAAEQANAAKDRFLAVLSHEMRTPLTPVLAAASELERDPALPDRVRGWMGVIRRNVELEARLLDDLLDLTRISRGKLTLETRPVGVRELLEQVIQICAAEAASKELVIRLDMQERDWRMCADPSRTLQVLWNLLNNAIKYTPPGGSIDLRCTADSAGGMACIEIADTGVGMAPELLARVFDAFEQGGRPGEHDPQAAQRAGLGLGLSIARALVEGQGGRITARSPGPGRGSTLRVELPLAGESVEAHEGQAAPGSGRRPAGAAMRVLLIEDHEDSAEILSRLLDREGVEVRVARSGREALAAVAAESFDLVISDIGLPDMPGYELFPRLRELQPSLRGVALSGFGMDEDVARCLDAGFGEHLTKPIDFQKLRALLRQHAPK